MRDEVVHGTGMRAYHTTMVTGDILKYLKNRTIGWNHIQCLQSLKNLCEYLRVAKNINCSCSKTDRESFY